MPGGPCFGFEWRCPVCGWKGEVHVACRLGLRGDSCLHVGDEFHLPDGWPARDLLIYETFACPECSASSPNCYLAEIRSFGTHVWQISAFQGEREEERARA